MKIWKLPILSLLAFGALASAQTVYSPLPTSIVGQPILQNSGTLSAIAPNLVEGREFFSPQGVAVDTSANPPILYVVDAGNNRILVWKNASGFASGDKADMVIGQRDFLSVTPQGPSVSSASLSTGLNSPTAAVVDSNGNLYVADSGNNRVVRYPKPAQQTGSLLVIDLVLGQKDTVSGAANQGLPAPTAKTLALTSGGALISGLAIDGANLWVSDSGNNRVLRYNGILIAQNPTNNPAADVVLGQADFVTSALPAGTARNTKNFLQQPAGLAFDQAKRLFVADAQNRISVYAPGAPSGSFSVRLMGIVLPTQQNPTPAAISASTLGSSTGGPPLGVFTIGNTPYVVDSGNHRVLRYDTFDNFPPENVAFSPAALSVFGQPDFFSGTANAGLPQPGPNTLRNPVGGAVANNTLFLADAGNNRVLSIPINSDGSLAAATRVLGQVNFQYNSVNLIEGREFGFSINGTLLGGGVAIDRNSNPPHLYVSDPLNNRVLGFADYRKVKAGSTADLVLGQPDFFTAEINYPVNLTNQPQDTGLSSPQGIALDSAGNLWVADAGNARVLRFPSPFNQTPLSSEKPNLVLGQSGFFTKVTDASASTMSVPFGIAFASDGSVLVSDAVLNRVLYFRRPKGGDFSSGAAANTVFGQPDFGPASETTLVRPRGITVDLDDRLYVANSGSTQVQIVIYPNVGLVQNDPQPVFAFNTATALNDTLHNPFSIFVDPRDGTFWVADTSGSRLLRYPNFQSLSTNAIANATLTSFSPVGVTVDPFGNPVAVEGATNRVAFFSPGIDATSSAGGIPGRFSGNGANYFQRFAPAMLASIFAYSTNSFGVAQPVNAAMVPLPTTLGDLQVTVAGILAPLLYVSGSQINFEVPIAVQPSSQLQEIRVTVASTRQVIASGYFRFDATAPGLFTANSSGSGQLSVLNQDNTVNGAANPAKAGTVIQIFGTGSGLVSGQPADGVPAPGALPTDAKPDVYIGPGLVPSADVSYSGLAPGFVGLWQINVKVPANVAPGDTTLFVIYPSVVGEASSRDQFGIVKVTTIRTAPAQQ